MKLDCRRKLNGLNELPPPSNNNAQDEVSPGFHLKPSEASPEIFSGCTHDLRVLRHSSGLLAVTQGNHHHLSRSSCLRAEKVREMFQTPGSERRSCSAHSVLIRQHLSSINNYGRSWLFRRLCPTGIRRGMTLQFAWLSHEDQQPSKSGTATFMTFRIGHVASPTVNGSTQSPNTESTKLSGTLLYTLRRKVPQRKLCHEVRNMYVSLPVRRGGR